MGNAMGGGSDDRLFLTSIRSSFENDTARTAFFISQFAIRISQSSPPLAKLFSDARNADEIDLMSSPYPFPSDAAAKYPKAFGPAAFVAAALLIAVGVGLTVAARNFALGELRHFDPGNEHPQKWGTRPQPDSTDASPVSVVAIDIFLQRPVTKGDDALTGIDPATISEKSFRVTTSTGRLVPGRASVGVAGDTIAFTPSEPFKPGATYSVEVTPELRDVDGRSMKSETTSFTVATDAPTQPVNVAFDRAPQPASTAGAIGVDAWYTCVAMGPDGRLYAGTYRGHIVRFDVAADGSLSNPLVINTIRARNVGADRTIGGIAFDPASKPDAIKLWVTHSACAPFRVGAAAAANFTGSVSVLSGDDLGSYRDVVVNLPRSARDHYAFQPAFGPDGALYWNQPSMTAFGAPDRKWCLRVETPLSAALLRLEPALVGDGPLDSRGVDLKDASSPLTVYASGLRSSYDVVFHSGGPIYAFNSGSPAGGNLPGRVGTPDAPTLLPIYNIKYTTEDTLEAIVKDGYHGQPNPSRGEYVLNGANPTAGSNTGGDPYGVSDYPEGTKPEKRWRLPVLSLGRTNGPMGAIEYHNADAFGGYLRGAVMVCRYLGGKDIVVMPTESDGSIRSIFVGIDGLRGFVDPIDLVEDVRNGNLYVAEQGAGRITLLKPAARRSETVYLLDGRPR